VRSLERQTKDAVEVRAERRQIAASGSEPPNITDSQRRKIQRALADAVKRKRSLIEIVLYTLCPRIYSDGVAPISSVRAFIGSR
jgi:hypothetical protein